MQNPRQKYVSKARSRDTWLLEDAFPLWHTEVIRVLHMGFSGWWGRKRHGRDITTVEATSVDNIMSLYV